MSFPFNRLSDSIFPTPKTIEDLSDLDSLVFEQEKPVVEDSNEDKYIIYAKQIDTHSIKRTRNKLTPAVCDICGLDLLKLAYEQNKISVQNYDSLSEEAQNQFKSVVALHKQRQHNAGDNLIISKSQLPKKWLGGRNE